MAEKLVDLQKFDYLAKQGLNCKQIAKEFNIHPHSFGFKMKKLLGIYPSQYIKKNYG